MTHRGPLVLRGGWVFDPEGRFGGSGHHDVMVDGESVTLLPGLPNPPNPPNPPGLPSDVEELDCSGCWVTPGWIDLRTRLREPGDEHKEDIQSGLAAAAAGGFTAVCTMPGTRPCNDVRAVTEQIVSRASAAQTTRRTARLWPFGAISKGLLGQELAEMADMKAAGIVGVTDDHHSIANPALLRRAFEYARTFDLVVAQHCDDAHLSGLGVMHEGVVSTQTGMVGIPRSAEEAAISTAIALARETGARLHIPHLSSGGSVALIRNAKAEGLSITADVTPHHLFFTDDALRSFDPMYKVLPPLRSKADRIALRAGINDGTIDAIATDHSPHAPLDKDCEFAAAAFGMINLELTAAALCSCIAAGTLKREACLRALSAGPNAVLKKAPSYDRGDLTIIDPDLRWTPSPSTLHSKSSNTPFLGTEIRGAARYTIVSGALVHANLPAQTSI